MVVTRHGVTGQRALRHAVLATNYVIEIVQSLNQLMAALIVKGLGRRSKNASHKYYVLVGYYRLFLNLSQL